jgi:hypothetical protein
MEESAREGEVEKASWEGGTGGLYEERMASRKVRHS